VANGPSNSDGDGEAVESLRSSIEANDRMIADVDRLLSRRNGGPCETDSAEPEPTNAEPLPRSAS